MCLFCVPNVNEILDLLFPLLSVQHYRAHEDYQSELASLWNHYIHIRCTTLQTIKLKYQCSYNCYIYIHGSYTQYTTRSVVPVYGIHFRSHTVILHSHYCHHHGALGILPVADSLILLFGRVPCMLEHQCTQCLHYVLPKFSTHYSCIKSFLDSPREGIPVRYEYVCL